MSIATIEIQPRVKEITFSRGTLTVRLQDGRGVSVPLQWYPRLERASPKERSAWRVFQDSDARDIIYWEELDELIPVIALLTGTPSRESKKSFEKWLTLRESRHN